MHAREKAEDAEAAAALRELEKALTNYQDAEAEVAQGIERHPVFQQIGDAR